MQIHRPTSLVMTPRVYSKILLSLVCTGELEGYTKHMYLI